MRFKEMYPQIDELDLKIESKNLTGKLMNSSHFFTDDPVPSRVDCGNPQCVGGGSYNVIEILDPLIRASVRKKEGSVVCKGYEKIGVGTRSCICMAAYKVRIRYKQLRGQGSFQR
jgi:hypothetical protein